ncbi:RRM domain-containing protein [Caenorhabditis elegans]|uniref:RRM domain-containing protein n=1 Tax=Caenorhabditis elegans TaxID=6239 RepID=F5GUG5_CAEEL|nr:RRM domain-containing protein [Caenorhabditis elegans]CCA65625.1 RRM domain-containing protein [Caenorhabditis elegans]|eukprot:NP_001254423.1 Uncharacterized protein CELE_W03H9.2 [Caenorhabditis elegans]
MENGVRSRRRRSSSRQRRNEPGKDAKRKDADAEDFGFEEVENQEPVEAPNKRATNSAKEFNLGVCRPEAGNHRELKEKLKMIGVDDFDDVEYRIMPLQNSFSAKIVNFSVKSAESAGKIATHIKLDDWKNIFAPATMISGFFEPVVKSYLEQALKLEMVKKRLD